MNCTHIAPTFPVLHFRVPIECLLVHMVTLAPGCRVLYHIHAVCNPEAFHTLFIIFRFSWWEQSSNHRNGSEREEAGGRN